MAKHSDSVCRLQMDIKIFHKCKTPSPVGLVPIPYPNIAMMQSAKPGQGLRDAVSRGLAIRRPAQKNLGPSHEISVRAVMRLRATGLRRNDRKRGAFQNITPDIPRSSH